MKDKRKDRVMDTFCLKQVQGMEKTGACLKARSSRAETKTDKNMRT